MSGSSGDHHAKRVRLSSQHREDATANAERQQSIWESHVAERARLHVREMETRMEQNNVNEAAMHEFEVMQGISLRLQQIQVQTDFYNTEARDRSSESAQWSADVRQMEDQSQRCKAELRSDEDGLERRAERRAAKLASELAEITQSMESKEAERKEQSRRFDQLDCELAHSNNLVSSWKSKTEDENAVCCQLAEELQAAESELQQLESEQPAADRELVAELTAMMRRQ